MRVNCTRSGPSLTYRVSIFLSALFQGQYMVVPDSKKKRSRWEKERKTHKITRKKGNEEREKMSEEKKYGEAGVWFFFSQTSQSAWPNKSAYMEWHVTRTPGWSAGSRRIHLPKAFGGSSTIARRWSNCPRRVTRTPLGTAKASSRTDRSRKWTMALCIVWRATLPASRRMLAYFTSYPRVRTCLPNSHTYSCKCVSCSAPIFSCHS